MQNRHRSHLITGIIAGAMVTASAAILMGQGASQPVKSEVQYFVTADGDHAHLWVREGTALRVVGHGECKNCPMHGDGHDHDHDKHDGHDDGHDKPKK